MDSSGILIIANAFSSHRERPLGREESIPYYCGTIKNELLQSENVFFNMNTLDNEGRMLYIGQRFLYLCGTTQ